MARICDSDCAAAGLGQRDEAVLSISNPTDGHCRAARLTGAGETRVIFRRLLRRRGRVAASHHLVAVFGLHLYRVHQVTGRSRGFDFKRLEFVVPLDAKDLIGALWCL